jgi:hypothetical protein
METIVDGTGSSYEAKVDSDNRLNVYSVQRDLSSEAARLGRNYNVNTGAINLTSANKSAVAYIKNNDDLDYIIKEVIVILGASTGGTGDLIVDLVANPTAGTIVSGAVDMDIIANRNFGSTRPFNALAYKGAEANTITDGADFSSTTRSSAGTVINFDADVIELPKGASIGVNVTPQASNTSMNVKVAFVGYFYNR